MKLKGTYNNALYFAVYYFIFFLLPFLSLGFWHINHNLHTIQTVFFIVVVLFVVARFNPFKSLTCSQVRWWRIEIVLYSVADLFSFFVFIALSFMLVVLASGRLHLSLQ